MQEMVKDFLDAHFKIYVYLSLIVAILDVHIVCRRKYLGQIMLF